MTVDRAKVIVRPLNLQAQELRLVRAQDKFHRLLIRSIVRSAVSFQRVQILRGHPEMNRDLIERPSKDIAPGVQPG